MIMSSYLAGTNISVLHLSECPAPHSFQTKLLNCSLVQPFGIIKLRSQFTLGSPLGRYTLKYHLRASPCTSVTLSLMLTISYQDTAPIHWPQPQRMIYIYGKLIVNFSPRNSRWLFMLSHTAEEDSKQWDSRAGKAWILRADLKAGKSATVELSFLRCILHKLMSGQLMWLPAKRDAVFHFQNGFPRAVTFSVSDC